MEASEGSQRSSLHKAHLYDFCIKFLRITGIRLPIPPKTGTSVASSSKDRHRYFLKITLLQGTEQHKIGDFEVIGDECIINHQLSFKIANGRQEKLHVYIDQDWSAGLSGHIAVDFKEFFEDVDAEICLEYPLFSSGPSHVRRTAKLEIRFGNGIAVTIYALDNVLLDLKLTMSVLCTCSTKKTSFSNQVDPILGYMCFEDLSKLRPSLDDHWYPPVRLDTESSHDAPSMLLDSVLKQVSPASLCLEKVDRETEMLTEIEGDLIELNLKLNKYVAAQSLETNVPGQFRSNVSPRPEVLAAMFFAAGMAFQRQVDSVNRLRMYRGIEDPLLSGENPRLLLEDVSPTFRSEASTNPEVREADTFCQASSRSLVLSESSSHSCGLTQSCSCSSEAATSLAGDMDEDENDKHYFDSPLSLQDMPMSLPDPESVSPRNSKNTSSPLGGISTSKETMNLVKHETVSEQKGSKRKNNVLSVVGSVLGVFAMVGLSGSESKETHSRGSSRDEQVTVAGSMLGRQRVTSIEAVRKSNPGLGWLSNAVQLE